MLKPSRKVNILEVVLISLCIASAYFSLGATGVFDVPRLKTNDLFLRVTHKIKAPPLLINQIALIIIDDDSYAKMGLRAPWRRDVFALFLRKIKDHNPKLVILDFTPVGVAAPEEDTALSKAMKDMGKVFLASYFSPTGEHVLPLKIFQESCFAYGVIDKPRDKDNIIRSAAAGYLSMTQEGKLKVVDYSLEVKAAADYLGIPLNNIRFGHNGSGPGILLKGQSKELRIPLKEDMVMPLNYAAVAGQFPSIPFWKIIKGEVPKGQLENKIVIVGETGEIFHDIHPTPFGLMAGVVILANNLLMLLTGNFIKEFTPWGNILIFTILGLVAGIVTHRFSLLKGLAFVVLETAGFVSFALILNLRNWQIDTFSPVFIMATTYGAIGMYEYFALLKEAGSLRTLAITDGLTGLYVYRYFQVRLEYELERVQRYAGELSLLILDVDHFKNFNDTYGHEAGNTCLKAIAQVMRDSSRKVDILARYGGEEFCVILPNINTEQALNYAEKLRKEIESLEILINNGEKTKVTVSIGVFSFLPDKPGSTEEIIERADKALYEAKETGRNKVCLFRQAA